MTVLTPHRAEHLFHGAFADEYHFLKVICPLSLFMSERVGDSVVAFRSEQPELRSLSALEIGTGTGVTTQLILSALGEGSLISIDNAPAMMVQAETHLEEHLVSGRLRLITDDALSALYALPSESMDLVLSAYTLHNFLEGYRREVLKEILRVLKPKGWFVNGDRYGVDDPAEHLKTIQDEVRGYFRVFREINRPDLLEQWVVHLLSDESDEHRMRLTTSIDVMQSLGFGLTTVSDRPEVNTLLISRKPCL